jgi:azurin
MNKTSSIALALFALLGAKAVTVGAEPAKAVIIVANDTMKFSVTRIAAAPGQALHVELRNEGTLPKVAMGHNWILLMKDSQANDYATQAMAASAEEYQPKALASEVLAAIKLLGPRQVGTVDFTAPTQPGTYPFICSFPGHAMAGMRGELVVH